jgi:dolichol-phosphate mannosyltransferase
VSAVDGLPAVSVVIPARNEAGALAALIAEVHGVLAGSAHEIVVVDDGSTDDTPHLLEALQRSDAALRCLTHPASRGKSAAVVAGIRAARGELIVTLDGDGQNDPRFIAPALALLADPQVGLVAGQRRERSDGWAKKWGSRLANGVRSWLLGDGTRDTGCGFKAGRRAVLADLPYFEGLHRFLPALVLADGWSVRHLDVVDRPRTSGRSHYGIMDRLAVGIPDLFGVAWLARRRRGRRPPRSSQST